MRASSSSRLSYKDRRSHQQQRLRAFVFILIIAVLYILLTTYFISPWVLQSKAMEPALISGARVLVVPCLQKTSQGQLENPPRRGDIVAIRPPYIPETPWHLSLLNSIVRLITLQKLSFSKPFRHIWENEIIFKRVIGIPGDTIRMEGSLSYVKQKGEERFLSEFERSGLGYDIAERTLPAGWNEDMPLSGKSKIILLDSNQYFVLGDNRNGSNDSSYWGPIDESAIHGRAVFVYWPIKSVGKLP